MKKTAIFFLLTLSIALSACGSPDKTPASDTSPTGTGQDTTTSDTDTDADKSFIVDEPKENSKITSPVSIKGSARGNMFFEASFGIDIEDADDKKIGAGTATAIGNWMTEDFVPFTAAINFETPTTKTGFIVLKKDSPSGLPENDLSIKIPVQF